MTMLAGSSGTVMTGGMKKELVVMEKSLQAAVAGAVREAVRVAVQRGIQQEQARKTAEELSIISRDGSFVLPPWRFSPTDV